LKPRSNALSKRRKIDQPNATSEKSNKNDISSEQLNKRQKIDVELSAEGTNVENDSMSALTPLKPSSFSGCKTLEKPPQTSAPDEPQKGVESLLTTPGAGDVENSEDSTKVITADAEITSNDVEHCQTVPKGLTESNDSVDISKNSARVSLSGGAENDSDKPERLVSAEESSMIHVDLSEIELPVKSISTSKKGLESISPNKTR
jgi:hypothetical protein